MQFDSVVESLLPLIKIYRANQHCELEGSLGIIDPLTDNFTPGVDFNYFKALLGSLSRAKDVWTKSENQAHFVRFNYPGEVRGTYNVTQKPDFIKKTTLRKLDIKCQDRKYDLRISLRKEQPLPTYQAKERPIFTRLYERWTYVHKNIWQFDFSKVSGGTTKEVACNSPPVFEVELELLPIDDIASWSDIDIANHIVEKLVDLLGRFDTDSKPFPLRLSVNKTWTSSQKRATGVI